MERAAMVTLYETLGVPPSATQDEIKAGYRRASSAAHPDRDGGSDAAMAAVNAANDILSDIARRAEYDRTGGTGPLFDAAAKAREQLVQMFTMTLQSSKPGEVLRDIAEMLANGEAQAFGQKSQAEAMQNKLKARKDAIRRKNEGENLASMVLDQQIAQAQEVIATADRTTAVIAEIRKLLEDYESTEVWVPPRRDAYETYTGSMGLGSLFGTKFGTGPIG
jgi:curved DNA-binding protein CbpA